MDVSIIGGAGHVGLAMGLVVTDAGHETRLVDTDTETLAEIASGKLPYKEPRGDRILTEGLEAGRIHTAEDVSVVGHSDVVVIVVGTPIDEHNNPEMENLFELVDELTDHLRRNQVVVLRSTVYPGTTANVRDALEGAGIEVGEDVFLAYAPERITQHRAIEEMETLPQLIGAFDEASFEATEAFFDSFLRAPAHRLTPTEAEIGKLFTNMWRYITFAIANECYLIADSFADYYDVNVHRIIEQTQKDYPRFEVPTPGANVGGPCLTKDGWFLVDNIPFNDLVSAAFQINEGMPSQIIQRLVNERPEPEKIVLLGMTYKAGSDDTRNSVAFKFQKQLFRKGFHDVVRIEPHLKEFDDWADVEGADWVVLVTPHDEFADLRTIADRVDNPEAVFCDVWGLWSEMKHRSDNGYFRGKEIPASIDAPASNADD